MMQNLPPEYSPRSLSGGWWLCQAPGCDWMVKLPLKACQDHGGRRDLEWQADPEGMMHVRDGWGQVHPPFDVIG